MSVSIAVLQRPALTRESLVFRARALVVFGLLWHSIEAAATLAAGIPASSSAMVGFGADVTVETVGGLVMLWRLSWGRALSESAERTAQRLIGVSYWLLATFVAYDSTQMLLSGERPETSVLGIVIAVLALIAMPPLRRAKAKVGDGLGSSAVKREGRENMMCAYLSICLLTGLGLNAALGWWWADPVSAYGVAAIAVVAGRRAWLGVNCCAAPCCASPTKQLQGGISN